MFTEMVGLTRCSVAASEQEDLIMKTGNRKQIMVVDDEANIREVVQTCLETLAGWEVVVAGSAREAFAVLESTKPDAILLDVMMPEMDGISFLEQLRINHSNDSLPVIFLTANSSLMQPHKYHSLGALGIIGKPFNPLNLVGEISQLLGWDLENLK